MVSLITQLTEYIAFLLSALHALQMMAVCITREYLRKMPTYWRENIAETGAPRNSMYGWAVMPKISVLKQISILKQREMHLCIAGHCQHRFNKWLDAKLTPIHFLNQWWFMMADNLRNKLLSDNFRFESIL